MQLKDKVALITGGGSGIGKAIVLKFSEEGAKVILNDVNVDNAKKIAKKVETNGGEVLVCIADVRKKNDVENMKIDCDNRVQHLDFYQIKKIITF